MSLQQLPADLQGSWIWADARLDKTEEYVFFRREFSLTEIPTGAELLIAANSGFHVYINGRHICRGPVPSRRHTANVVSFNVGHCLDYGNNVVSVLAHNVNISRYSNSRRPSGLWCQLTVDGTVHVCSDGS